MPQTQQILHINEIIISIIPNASTTNGNIADRIIRTIALSITINNNIIIIHTRLRIPQIMQNKQGQIIIIFLIINKID